MVTKFRQRLARRNRAKIAALAAAAEAGDLLYAGDDDAYRRYLIENDADPEVAESLVKQREHRSARAARSVDWRD